MHEASIVTSLLEQVRAFTPPGGTVLSVRIEVGVLEHIDDEALRSLWAILSGEELPRGPELSITRTPLRVRCGECGAVYDPPDPAFLYCPGCGVARPEVLQGSGVVLRSIEVDVPEGDG